jgi:hypothetical protein
MNPRIIKKCKESIPNIIYKGKKLAEVYEYTNDNGTIDYVIPQYGKKAWDAWWQKVARKPKVTKRNVSTWWNKEN